MMADFEPPSFSLGLNCRLLDSERQISSVTQDTDPNQLSIAAATLTDDDFQTLIVDDSRPVVDYEEVDMFSSQEDGHTATDRQGGWTNQPANQKQNVSSDHESVLASCDNPSVSDSNSTQCNAHRYFFHDDSTIQELVRSRLPNFSPLGNMFNRDLDQPCTSKIDYMGQFSHGESSKQADLNIKDGKRSSSRKVSKRSKIEEASQGWVNPKLDVDKGVTKGIAKRKVRAARKTSGHWLTDLDGKKVYVSKKGEELSGRVAYRQYRKESGAGFKRGKKRKSATKCK